MLLHIAIYGIMLVENAVKIGVVCVLNVADILNIDSVYDNFDMSSKILFFMEIYTKNTIKIGIRKLLIFIKPFIFFKKIK